MRAHFSACWLVIEHLLIWGRFAASLVFWKWGTYLLVCFLASLFLLARLAAFVLALRRECPQAALGLVLWPKSWKHLQHSPFAVSETVGFESKQRGSDQQFAGLAKPEKPTMT